MTATTAPTRAPRWVDPLVAAWSFAAGCATALIVFLIGASVASVVIP